MNGREQMQIDEIVKIQSVAPPNGIWQGVWSGYKVMFITPDGEFIGNTKDGIRGSKLVQVIVKDGKATLQ